MIYMDLPLSLQLYTVRNELKDDFVGTLEKVAEIGYKGVEFAGYGGLKANEMRRHLERLGLTPTGSHISLDALKSNLDKEIEYNLEIGNKYIVCPWNKYEAKEDFIETAKLFNEIGEKCAEKGLIFCYHNHNHEFVNFDGKYGLDLIYENSNSNFLKAEIDTYWVKYAGEDPASYIKKYSGRVPLVHLKDMDGATKDFAEIGEGIMNIKDIIDASLEAGVKWFIVEQDVCKRPPLESAKISFHNINKM
ncbi:xylose isomerase domain-containing protein [Thermoanaerobacterium aotearoense SCUT27]|uniref:Xylose isomerase domain-containing protein n=3 Tax=Thermoanaerobacterium TaxID=28895 RepID=W9E8T6_9THEO|nr:Xylose isomerase domain-containing protein TIM barrel [Thermoanaerobacterium saccharolyticum JW/SL-YS485]ETO37386.1 xylose isomerase domain-containing protein [Thermoanaerobacterium aotearoense SCUT27]